jgi:hypothetical protein
MSAYRFCKLGSLPDLESSSNAAALLKYSATLRVLCTSWKPTRAVKPKIGGGASSKLT